MKNFIAPRSLSLPKGRLITIFMLAAIFALSACNDSSSAGDDDNNVILSSDSREESSDSRSNDKDEAISSSGKSNDPAEVTDKSSDSKDNLSSAGTSTKSSNSNSSGTTTKSSNSSAGKVESSSSAVTLATPCKTETEDNCEYGELVDERDGQTYKTVKIGDQWWMAENLNYAYTGVPYRFYDELYDETYTSDSTSWCYDNEVSNCEKYGRLYTWSAVMDSAAQSSVNAGTKCGHGKTCTPNSPHRGICPEGWHLPTLEEWLTLLIAVGGDYGAGRKLRSNNLPYNRGSDDYGFSVLYAGGYRHCGDCSSKGYYNALERTYFWSSTEGANTSIEAKVMQFDFHNPDVKVFSYEKFIANSVRCVKDSD